jgi:hypothetical protein
VKHILDKGALPQKVYDKFDKQLDLPIYQRTIIDACTRMRRLAYSNKINSTIGFEFLKLRLMFVRSNCITHKINIGFD